MLARTLLALLWLAVASPAGAGSDSRVASGLVAYYALSEGAGATASDRSPEDEAVDLGVTGRLTWLSQTTGENGVNLDGGRIGQPHPDALSSPSLDVIAALKASGQSTFELWISPADLATSGSPERMLSLGERMMFGQKNGDIEVWLLHTGKDASANPRLITNDAPLTTGLTHLVHTFDGSTETLYIDGVAHPTTVSASGDFSAWSDTGRLVLGHDARVQPQAIYEGFPWKGDVRLAAVYDRALSPAEVTTNFDAGPDAPLVWAGPELATQGLPGQPSQSVALGGSVPGPGVAALWTVESAPPGGIVTFGDDTAPATTADFSVDGSYRLRLSASEPGSSAWDEVVVDVNVPSSAIPQAQNVAPVDGATGVSLDPRLELVCESDATAARYVIATDDTFTTVVYDSGETELYYCGLKAFAGLAASTSYSWSARVRDGSGLWSDWSTPTGFTTADPSRLSIVSLQQGDAGYTGAEDVDIRGLSEDPFNPVVVWNQGAQDVLRTGRRVDDTLENYRSLLRFDVSGTGEPEALLDAYLELTGWMHGAVSANDYVFEAPHVFYEMLVPWGEGGGITDPPQSGEASWLHAEHPTLWNFPGAGGAGSDRGATALMRGALRNELDHQTQWSSAAFVEAVRGWLASPGSNQGLLLQAEDEVQPRTLKLGSKESPAANRPRLVLEFQTPARVALATPGVDFPSAGGSTTVGVEVRYDDGTPVASDSITQITFTPSGDAAIGSVVTGSGDGGYGTPGGVETVTVAGGIAEVVVQDATPESFTIAFANDAGLADPPPDAITARGPPSQVVLTVPGSDFAAGGSTALSLEVQDAQGNRVPEDDTSQLILTPSNSAAISGVLVGTGDGGYGTTGGPEVVTVSAGQAQVTVTDSVAETFTVSFANGAGLSNPPPDSIDVAPGPAAQIALSQPGSDFSAGGSSDVSVAVQDAHGNVIPSDSTTTVTFTPSGGAAVVAVVTGTGDGGYGVPGGAEVVTVAGGVATVTLGDTVAETFTLSFANGAALANPPDDAITVSPAAPSQVALTGPGADFAAGGSTALAVSIQDAFGNFVSADSTTQVTFTPSGSAAITGVTSGVGDGSYGVTAGPEVVTVAGGSAAITLTDTVAETFAVTFANDAGLADPTPDAIDVAAAAPAEVVLTLAGSDFAAGEGTSLAVALRDAFGNPVTGDSVTQIVFTPSGSASVSGVTTGTGDGGYGVPAGPEVVTVAGGAAEIAVNDTVAETFTVAFANGSGLVDPAPDEMVVSPAAASQLALSLPGGDFEAGQTTSLSVEVQDAFGNLVPGDDTTQVTFTPSGGAFVAGVPVGTGDGGYGVSGGAEIVTLSASTATIDVGNQVAESFTVAFANDAGLADPVPDAITSQHATAAEIVQSVLGADFAAGVGTSLTLEILDGFGNLVTDDDTTQVTFTPSGSGRISGVTTGTGDGSYGVPGAAESLAVSGGVATVDVNDDVAETFTVSFANGASLPGPAPDSIDVGHAAPSQVALSVPGGDFAAGEQTGLSVSVQDAFGNAIPGDSTTQVTFTPSGNASISAVTTGTGDGAYGVAAGPETVTVSGGVAAITLTDTVAESFTVSTANDAALADPAPDAITVSAAAAAQFVLSAPAPDFAAGDGTSLTVAIQDAFGNVVAADTTSQVAFIPSDNAAVTDVTTGTGDGNYGGVAFPEIVTVDGGLAAVTLNDTVAETFTVGLANDQGFANPPDDVVTVVAAAASEIFLATPGDDFTTDGSTSLSLRIRDVYGNTVSQDDTTQVTFAPSGGAFVSGVAAGTGDGAYGVPAGAETVAVSGGVATITLADAVAETFTVSFANDAALPDPPPDQITVSPGAPSQLAISAPGVDFQAGASTALEVEVQDASGNRIPDDATTQVTFTPAGSARITAVGTGTGDGSYGVIAGAETVTVSGGAAAVTLADTVAETFTVSTTNDAGLADPAPDAITVSPAAASELALIVPGDDFVAGAGTGLAVALRDAFGNTRSGDDATRVTFTPSGGAAVSGVTTGVGDGSYGVSAGAEVVTVSGGVAAITLVDTVAETFTVSTANDAGVPDPAPDAIDVSPAAASQLALTVPGSDFAAGGDTPLEVRVQDAFGNTVSADGTTGVTFTPSGGASVSAVATGTGDGSYGVAAGAETVTVSGGVATITLTDTVAETFTVSIANDAGLGDPAPDAITVVAAAPSAVVLFAPAGDFAAGGSTGLTVTIRDAHGNDVTADSSTQVTFTPSGGAFVSAVTTGTGDGGYGVAAGPETVTVAGGVAAIALGDTVAETFAVSFANGSGLSDPPPDDVTVSAGAASEVFLGTPGVDFVAGGGTTVGVEIRDAFGNRVAGDGSSQVTFAPTGSARIQDVTVGSGDGDYGAPGGAETVTVSAGLATVAVEDAVAETFTVSFANDAGLADPAPDSITVSAGPPSQLALTLAGADFVAGGGTSLEVTVQDASGNPVPGDSTTQVTFTPSGSASVAGVTVGTGDGGYGVAGGAETVTVAAGVAAIDLADTVAETFTVSTANDAGLWNPADDVIAVSPASASEVFLSGPGADFVAGESTPLSIQVRDAFGNAVTDDFGTGVTFTPSGSAFVSDVTTGTGDGGYGVVAGAETVTVLGGAATIVLGDAEIETFTVSFANDAGLANPADDVITAQGPPPEVPALGPLARLGVALLLLLVGRISLGRTRRS